MLWNILLPVNWLAAMVTKANEGDLLESLRNGDQKAWREVLERYGPMLIGYATRLLKSRDRAEEVVQEAIVSVHGGLERFEGRCSLKSWLFRAVHNKAIDELRRSGRFVSPPDDENGRWEERFTDRGGWAADRGLAQLQAGNRNPNPRSRRAGAQRRWGGWRGWRGCGQRNPPICGCRT